MKNQLLAKDYLRTAIQFSYNIPWGVKVKTLEKISFKIISVFCKPDFEDNLQFCFTLLNDRVGELFFDVFDDTPLANASALSMHDVETVVRKRIAEGLCGASSVPMLKRSTLHAVCGYHITPEISGVKDVRLLLKCFSPTENAYQTQAHLYIKGIDLGVVDERTVHGVEMTFRSFSQRADAIAEGITEDNFASLVVEMALAYNAKIHNTQDENAKNETK